MPFLPFGLAPSVLDRLQIPLQSYEALVKNISKILHDGSLLGQKGSTESALDSTVSHQNGTSASNTKEARFAEAYIQILLYRSQKYDKEELSWDDVGNAFKSASKSITGGVAAAYRPVVDGTQAAINGLTDAASKDTSMASVIPGQILGSIVGSQTGLGVLNVASSILGIVNKTESSFDNAKSENIFEDAEAAITTIARAFVLRTVRADELPNATMQQPTGQLKEEGFFGDVLVAVDRFGKGFTHKSWCYLRKRRGLFLWFRLEMRNWIILFGHRESQGLAWCSEVSLGLLLLCPVQG